MTPDRQNSSVQTAITRELVEEQYELRKRGGQVWWRQIEIDVELGYPTILGMTTAEYVEGIGGYIKIGIHDRRAAVIEMTERGLSQRKIASVLGVGQATVHRDSYESRQAANDAQHRGEATSSDSYESIDDKPASLVERRREQAREQAKQEQATSERLFNHIVENNPGGKERMERSRLLLQFATCREQVSRMHVMKPKPLVAAMDQREIERSRDFIARSRRWLDALEVELSKPIRLVDGRTDADVP